jgi:hypothetical protein
MKKRDNIRYIGGVKYIRVITCNPKGKITYTVNNEKE